MYIPLILNEEQKADHVSCAKKINKLFKKKKNRLISDTVTGDETWVRYLPLQRWFDNEVWMTKCIWKAFSYCQTGSEHINIFFFFAIFLNSDGVLLQFPIFPKKCYWKDVKMHYI